MNNKKILASTIGMFLAISGGLFYVDAHWSLPLVPAGVLGFVWVCLYTYKRISMSNEAGNEPLAAPMPPVKRGPIGILLENSPGARIIDHKFVGMDVAIKAVNSRDLRAEDNDIS